ncbi:DEAD/DEAH box helicase [Candidatus Woesearchaeota archaeon]|nr:DEAD/DEAH box helicase [Candidatus Woesearchaeota archaeon]
MNKNNKENHKNMNDNNNNDNNNSNSEEDYDQYLGHLDEAPKHKPSTTVVKKATGDVLTFKQFTLDKFQVDAIRAIEENESVVVTAQTGSGKTLIADYIIDKFMHSGKRVIYTAPIKALSNQKFRDFKRDYGEEKVGIMTGDFVINSHAPILIMTTEIYRNMLLCNDPSLEHVSYVVFDEIHYINDIERGTIWEESLIFSPESIRFLCLSATIPNAHEFAHWIETIKEHKVHVVSNDKRVVPLKHLLFDSYLGMTDIASVQKHAKEIENIPDYYDARNRKHSMQGGHKQGKKKKDYKLPSHMDLVKDMQAAGYLPCIYFVFSRKATQEKAEELIRTMNFAEGKDIPTIVSMYNKYIHEDIKQLESSKTLKRFVQRGVAIHHAGMLPKQKELVEELFAIGLIKVLYATETFAVGINMPAKAVCFNTLEKYDGISFRYLHTKEYFQLAGRAGRRGIDPEGYAIALYNRNHDDLSKIEKLCDKDVEPIISQFTLSYNTVLNLLDQHNEREIEIILKKSFDYYLKKKKFGNIRVMASFHNKVKTLQKLGYVSSDRKLTEKGQFARLIYAYELLIAELCTSSIAHELTDLGMIATLATIMFEGRRGVEFSRHYDKKAVGNTLRVLSKHPLIFKKINVSVFKGLHPLITHWYNGGDFVQMMRYSNMLEGDYIRLFRQILDMFKQIKRATHDYDLIKIVDRCTAKIDRDVVKVEF